MSVKDSKIREVLEKSAAGQHDFLNGVDEICAYAVARSVTIRDTFPMFTRHDEMHICNVLAWMEKLLGDRIADLNQHEAALLLLAACCHDIGMSCDETERAELERSDRFLRYLEEKPVAYCKAYPNGQETPVVTDELFRDFLRSIHHERAEELLCDPRCPFHLEEWMRKDLIWICQSHGESCRSIERDCPDCDYADLRLCAVLLRLADILDFDTSRAPQALYDYCGFDRAEGPEAVISRAEWDKHKASHGFRFEAVQNRTRPYALPYAASPPSMQIEKAVRSYLDWVDDELTDCGRLLRKFDGKWKDLVLPDEVSRTITPVGYVSGEYRFTMDQDRVLRLLGGEELYSDPGAFVRELLQNAIDAVRTREALDKNRPRSWKPQIRIRTWRDTEGDWFRIEDNGTGMTEDIIQNYLLKVGCSYYKSDEFEKEKRSRGDDPDYTPISRFGVGILSCFMGDPQHSLVEISTKRYRSGDAYPPALRLRMEGLNGYYALYSQAKQHRPGPMPGQRAGESDYRREPGTVVVVRTDLYRSGKYRGFREIVDHYVCYPPVPIHYDGPEGARDYPTQQEFMEAMHQIAPSEDLEKQGVLEFELTDEQLSGLRDTYPSIDFSDPPKLILKCVPLDRYSSSPNLSGAVVAVKAEGGPYKGSISASGERYEVSVRVEISRGFFPHPVFLHCLLDEASSVSLRSLIASREHLSQKSLKMSENDFRTLNSLRGQGLRVQDSFFSLDLNQFSQFSWFQRWFQSLQSLKDDYGRCFCSSHNGIRCGDTSFFASLNDDSHAASVLLLRDSYRPELSLSRETVQGLPLEAAAECDLIRKRLNREGFALQLRLSHYDYDKSRIRYRYVPEEHYRILLQKHPEWEEQLLLNTAQGPLTVRELSDRMKTGENRVLIHDDRLRFFGRAETYSSPDDAYLYAQLSFACLKTRFRLFLHRDQEGDSVLVRGERPQRTDDSGAFFPPGLFLPAEDGDSSILARSSTETRYACNSLHRLSRFLLERAALLNRRSPGSLRRILIALAQDRAVCIKQVNEQLKLLQSIPDNPLHVTDELFLTRSDFI